MLAQNVVVSGTSSYGNVIVNYCIYYACNFGAIQCSRYYFLWIFLYMNYLNPTVSLTNTFLLPTGRLLFLYDYSLNFSALFSSSAQATTLIGSLCKSSEILDIFTIFSANLYLRFQHRLAICLNCNKFPTCATFRHFSYLFAAEL